MVGKFLTKTFLMVTLSSCRERGTQVEGERMIDQKRKETASLATLILKLTARTT